MEQPSPNQAIILSGGGAAGAYEVGVMKALFGGSSPSTGFRELTPGIFTGTSVGAINAALVLSSPEKDAVEAVRELERIYIEEIAASTFGSAGALRIRANPLPFLHPATFFDGAEILRFGLDVASLSIEIGAKIVNGLFSTDRIEERLLSLVDLSLMVDTSAVRSLLERYLSPHRIAKSGKVLRIVATDWSEGTLKMFCGEDLHGEAGIEIILASAAIPAIFRQVTVDGLRYVDGGIVMNSALKPAIDAGADEIHLVYVDPALKDVPIPPNAGSAAAGARALAIALAAMLNRDLDAAARINLGLHLMTEPGAALESPIDAGKAALQTLAHLEQQSPSARRYRPITIHRYRPDMATPGTIRWLDFSRDHIEQMIQMGYDDTKRHDCVRQQCVLPTAANAKITSGSRTSARMSAGTAD